MFWIIFTSSYWILNQFNFILIFIFEFLVEFYFPPLNSHFILPVFYCICVKKIKNSENVYWFLLDCKQFYLYTLFKIFCCLHVMKLLCTDKNSGDRISNFCPLNRVKMSTWCAGWVESSLFSKLVLSVTMWCHHWKSINIMLLCLLGNLRVVIWRT